MKTIFCFLACITASPLLADYSFVWAGSDSRFSGTFSISDADYANRSFSSITTVNFQFQDPQFPSHNLTLNTPDSLHSGNMDGMLTSDGQHLSHGLNPNSPFVSFWVAAWQFPGIEIGLYSYSPNGDPLEYFKLANYTDNVFAETTGVWSLQSVPEPSSACIMGVGILGVLVMMRRNQK